MRAPKSWISEYVDLPPNLTDQQIADGLVRVGFEVEEIIVQGADLNGPLVVGKVLAIEELKEHKKPIRYVELDCGEGQSRFVICGAQNFKVGDLIVSNSYNTAHQRERMFTKHERTLWRTTFQIPELIPLSIKPNEF